MQELRAEFLVETTFFLEQIEESFLLLKDPEKKSEQLASVFRLMHSIKGAGGAVGLPELSEFAHVVEDLLSILRVKPIKIDDALLSLLLQTVDALKARLAHLQAGGSDHWAIEAFKVQIRGVTESLTNANSDGVATKVTTSDPGGAKTKIPVQSWTGPAKPEAEASVATPVKPVGKQFVKVDLDRVDVILDTVGELVVIRSQLMTEVQAVAHDNPRLVSIIELYDRSIRDLQEKAMGLRLTPLKSTFVKLQRVARDLSVKLNKRIHVELHGEDTEIDRQVVEALADPLLHLVRNSLDHGIETADVRIKAGKPAMAEVAIQAHIVGSQIQISISDDGAGVDVKRVFAKAKSRGLISQETEFKSMTETEILDLIFRPGFSTAETVSEVSGRGVGLDVVKTNVLRLKGQVQVQVRPGLGTTFLIILPMKTSVTDGILIRSETHPTILPLDSILEILDAKQVDLISVRSKGQYLRWRNSMVPVFTMSQLLGKSQSGVTIENRVLLVIDCLGRSLGVLVEEILGQNQVVSKQIHSIEGQDKEMGGAAILGDGRVALVVDPLELWRTGEMILGVQKEVAA